MADEVFDVELEALRELVRFQGTRVDWFRAAICPCRGVSGVADESSAGEGCEFVCIGGWIYQKQTVSKDIADSLAVISDYNKTVYRPEFGRVPSGEAKWISMADECELSDHDIIVHRTAPELTKSLVKRRSNFDFDELAHPCVEGVESVSRGFQTWREGEHFEVLFDATGGFERARLRWLDVSDAPPAGSFYGVNYTRFPRLIWLDDANRPARRNHAGERLVQRGTLFILSLSSDNR